MAFMLRAAVEICWVPDGVGGAMLGQGQANAPGYGASYGPGSAPGAQTIMMRVAEAVPGGDSPTAANFLTALTAVATDLNTRLNTAGAEPGYTSGTPLALVQAWNTGSP